MLDNFPTDLMRSAVELIGGRVEVEASGGITLDSIRTVAETGVDMLAVSIGNAHGHYSALPRFEFGLLAELHPFDVHAWSHDVAHRRLGQPHDRLKHLVFRRVQMAMPGRMFHQQPQLFRGNRW